jgi:hypothetical protein
MSIDILLKIDGKKEKEDHQKRKRKLIINFILILYLKSDFTSFFLIFPNLTTQKSNYFT